MVLLSKNYQATRLVISIVSEAGSSFIISLMERVLPPKGRSVRVDHSFGDNFMVITYSKWYLSMGAVFGIFTGLYF